MKNTNLKAYFLIVLIFGLLLSMSIMVFSANNVEVSKLDSILERGVLKIGVPNSLRWSRINPDTGKWEGVSIDLMNYLAEQMNVKPEFVEVDWQIFPIALDNGDIDIFAGTAHYTVARAMKVAYPHPIFYKGTGVICKTENKDKFKTIGDINQPNVKIAVGIGTNEDQMAKYLYPKANVLRMKTGAHTELAQAVRSGQADLAAFGHLNAWRFSEDFDWCAMPLDPFSPSMQSFPIAYGDWKLLRFFDSFFQQASFSGLLDALVQKYFPDMPENIRKINR